MTTEEFIKNEYKDDNDISHESIEDFIQCGILDFCGCGNPEASLLFILKCLQAIDNLKNVHNGKLTCEQWNKINTTIYHEPGIEYFVYYWLDKEEYTTHGGSVPGWLTPKGEELLHNLINYKKDITKNEK